MKKEFTNKHKNMLNLAHKKRMQLKLHGGDWQKSKNLTTYYFGMVIVK